MPRPALEVPSCLALVCAVDLVFGWLNRQHVTSRWGRWQHRRVSRRSSRERLLRLTWKRAQGRRGSAWDPVILSVFKTGGRQVFLSPVGSTPTRFRHFILQLFRVFRRRSHT